MKNKYAHALRNWITQIEAGLNSDSDSSDYDEERIILQPQEFDVQAKRADLTATTIYTEFHYPKGSSHFNCLKLERYHRGGMQSKAMKTVLTFDGDLKLEDVPVEV